MDKTEKIEERLDNLENRLRTVFADIEKRLDDQKHHREEYSVEERIQEIEDLLLLLQLESTKIKEKVGTGLDFGIAPHVSDVSERLRRLEEGHGKQDNKELEDKIGKLEEKINDIHDVPVKVPKEVEKRVKTALSHDVRDLEKKIRTLEALLEKRGKQEIEETDDGILDDIQKILKKQLDG